MTLFQIKSKPHGHNRLQEFIKEGFIGIGWPGIGDLTGVQRDEIKDRLESKYNVHGQKLGNYLGSVNTFVNVMSGGDVVLLRDGEYVHIGIVGPYRYVPEFDNDAGLCHQRSTTWIATVNRRDLNASVQTFTSNRNPISKFPHPTEAAQIEKYLVDEPQSDRKSRTEVSDLEKAKLILRDALNSPDEAMRVQAAIAILNHTA